MTKTPRTDEQLEQLRAQLEQANSRDFIQRQKLMLAIHQLELRKGR